MVKILLRVKLTLGTLIRAATALVQSSDQLHERARRERDAVKAQALRKDADQDSDAAREINQALHGDEE